MVTDLSGNFLLQIGSTGEDGLRDGTFDDATFNRPQVSIKLETYSHSCFYILTLTFNEGFYMFLLNELYVT